MRYDFHSHTHYSDGVLSPADLVMRAENMQIELFAISDHDSVSGLAEAQQAIELGSLNLRLVNAIEISAQSDFGEVHIVGLNIDANNEHLLSAIKKQQASRWVRAAKIADKLSSINVHGVFEFLKENCHEVVTRTHIARALVTLGHVKDNQQAFKKYLGKKGRVKVPAEWMSLDTAIELIKNAGGIAILAHPTRYPMSNTRLSYLIEDFTQSGGEAIEMSYPSLSPDKQAWLNSMREKNELLASAGSDFHVPDLKWSDLGRFRQLDSKIPHVIDRI